ncbi:MAG: nicotinate-nucleotide adenylyltransferase [Acidimicrobiia bacterium]|nr:nicotinate-nucleotide adenylyltransferase [Acidimicrobiia bacterium]
MNRSASNGPERLGIFGGTFDPVHNGHLAAASEARAALELDTVLLLPAGEPWQKTGVVDAPAADRLALVEVAVSGIAGLEASDIEVVRRGPSYTVDTLEQLTQPERALTLLVGADVARGLSSWHRSDDLWDLATIAVFDRGETGVPPKLKHRVETVAVPRLEISSSDVRERLLSGRPVDGLVPAAVVREIRERHLYTARNG